MPAESKRRKLDGAWQTSQSQIAASLNSTSRASASIALPSQPLQLQNAPVQSLPPPMVSNSPFRDRRQMMLDALVGLSPDDRRLVEEQLQPDGDYERDTAEVLALRSQNQTRKPNQWIASMRKIACQILQFAPVVDVATNVKPEVLSLPWAGIRFLLMTAQKVHHQGESILKGIEIALDTSYLLNVYFDIYGRLDGTPTIGNLYHNMVKLYALILKFVAHARNACEMNRWERVVHSLTGVAIPNFETDHNGMLKTVEYHARAVDREVSEKQRAWVNQKLNTLEKAQQEINRGVQGDQQALDLSALQAAAGAAYDSINYRNADDIGELRLCLDGTRVQIRQKILDWATTVNDQRVFWLSGKAGTGKSTIALTVADELAKQGYLVGSFFFKRGHAELGRARILFPTIARQMADFVPSISHEIAAASKDSPPVNVRPLTTQFDTLIKGPLSGYSTGSATDIRAIVIDALDECEDREAIGHAMTLWPRLRAQSSMNLRVFVTSRSDNKIGDKLSEMGHKDLHHERLEHWQSSTIEDDLRLFCHDELRRLREQSRKESSYDELEDDWPGESVVDKLVDISKPLFIAASTIFREVSNDPRRQLREWVDRLNFTGSEGLNCIYSGILEQASRADPKWLGHFKRTIEPIAVLRAPLSIPALTDLLGEGDNMVVPNALKPLSSVIDFPSEKEVKSGSRATVRIYHESFRDFLVDPNLKDKFQFSIDKGKTHGILLKRCLDLLTNKLGRDVCKQKDPATERIDVSAEHVEKHISESVQYACRYWTGHAIHSNEAIEDGGQVDRFVRACLLYWVEAMAWLDKLGEMIVCLKQLQRAISPQSSPRLHSFIADALRWVPANRDLISDAPLQTYLSALAFAPSNSIVRNSFRSDMEVWPPAATDWGFELQTLRRHTDDILSITPSIDGRRLVTVGNDRTVRLWDVESGTEEKGAETGMPYHNVHEVASAFPEEDIVVIAASRGSHWRWNLEDDARRIDLELPSNANCVSVSPNGRYAAWGLKSGEIYIWDADKNAGQVVEGHSSSVECMAFSSDSETLVSGSTDIWKWSPQAGHKRICQVGTDIESIAISPNRKFVVFCSGTRVAYHLENSTISVFHCTTHEVDQILQDLPDVNSLMVTPDSQKVLFGDGDSLYLYDLQTQQEPMELRLRSGVTAMTLSPDGKTIWAGYWTGQIIQLDVDLALKSPQHPTNNAIVAPSTDGRSLALWTQGNQLSLWNIETRICERRLTDHRLIYDYTYDYRQILISSDSRFVVVASLVNSTLLIWNMDADELRELKDRPGEVKALALSPDNKTLLCGFYDGQIWAVDLERGVLREKFTGHTSSVNDIAISPDGQNFASRSIDDIIRIWGPESQTPLVLSSKHFASKACFSADGRMLYVYDLKNGICEWDIEKACIVRTIDPGRYGGSILIDGRFVSSTFLPVVDRLVANKAAQPQTQEDSSASTRSSSMFHGRQIWGLEGDYEDEDQWITVNSRKVLKLPDQPRFGEDWFSCGRKMIVPNYETGFTVFYFTGKGTF